MVLRTYSVPVPGTSRVCRVLVLGPAYCSSSSSSSSSSIAIRPLLRVIRL